MSAIRHGAFGNARAAVVRAGAASGPVPSSGTAPAKAAPRGARSRRGGAVSRAKSFVGFSRTLDGNAAIIMMPVELASESNSRSDWRVKGRRIQKVRSSVALWLTPCGDLVDRKAALTVTITRIAPHVLDDDNLRGACKAPRDQVAEWLGLPNDRDARVSWEYAQRSGGVRTYGTEIRFAPRSTAKLFEVTLRVVPAGERFRLIDAAGYARPYSAETRLVLMSGCPNFNVGPLAGFGVVSVEARGDDGRTEAFFMAESDYEALGMITLREVSP